jgi:hypothetical protein
MSPHRAMGRGVACHRTRDTFPKPGRTSDIFVRNRMSHQRSRHNRRRSRRRSRHSKASPNRRPMRRRRQGQDPRRKPMRGGSDAGTRHDGIDRHGSRRRPGSDQLRRGSLRRLRSAHHREIRRRLRNVRHRPHVHRPHVRRRAQRQPLPAPRLRKERSRQAISVVPSFFSSYMVSATSQPLPDTHWPETCRRLHVCRMRARRLFNRPRMFQLRT